MGHRLFHCTLPWDGECGLQSAAGGVDGQLTFGGLGISRGQELLPLDVPWCNGGWEERGAGASVETLSPHSEGHADARAPRVHFLHRQWTDINLYAPK